MHINKIHLINYVKSLPKELKRTYLLYTLRYLFVISFGLFLPVYIYKLTNSVLYSILFYFSLFLFRVPLLILIRNLLKKYSVETLQTISLILLLLTSLSTNLLGIILNFSHFLFLLFLIITGILFSASIIFYWIPQHLILGKYGKHNAEDFALFGIISNVLSVIMPIISGILIYLFGFETYYLSFMIIYLILILLFCKKKNNKTYIRDNLNLNIKFDPLFFFDGMQIAAYNLLFFYIYLMINDIIKWGFLNSVLNLILAVTIYVVSVFVDHRNNYNFGSLGYLVKGILFSIILFSDDVFIVSISMMLFGIVYSFAEIPYFGYFYYYIKTYGLNKVFERAINVAFGYGILVSIALLNLKLALIIGLLSLVIFSYIYYFRSYHF